MSISLSSYYSYVKFDLTQFEIGFSSFITIAKFMANYLLFQQNEIMGDPLSLARGLKGSNVIHGGPQFENHIVARAFLYQNLMLEGYIPTIEANICPSPR